MRKALILGLALIIVGGAGAYSWYMSRHRVLMEEPARGGADLSIPTKVSSVGVTVELPFSALNATANAVAPSAMTKNGRERKCEKHGPYSPPFVDLRVDVCLDVDYEFNAQRGGDIVISKSPSLENAFRIAVPVNFSGWAGFSGDLAKLLRLDRKNFRGEVIAYLDASVGIGSDWCPTIKYSISFNWKEYARLEIMGGVWISIADFVDAPMRSALENASKEITKVIECGRVKAEVAKIWTPRSFPIDVPQLGQVFVNIEPKSIGFSGLNVDTQKISFALSMNAEAEGGMRPTSASENPLPPLSLVPVTEGKIDIAFPARASYAAIVRAAESALKGKEFSLSTAAGEVKVSVNDIKLYPSGTRLVVGADIVADLPGNFFDTKGWVYFFAEPVAEGGKSIVLKNAGFSRVLDNSFWSVASSVFEGPIRAELDKASKIDLKPQFEEIEKALQVALKDLQAKHKVTISLTDMLLGISAIVPSDEALEVEAAFSAKARANLEMN